MIIQNFIGLLLSLSILIWSCDYAINNSIAISKLFKIREIFVGIFIISIGTSLPEFAVTFPALKFNAQGIVAGNLVGSNIANILLVGGIMLFPIRYLNIENENKSTFRFFLLFSILFFLLIFFDIKVDFKIGIFLIILIILFFYVELKKPVKAETYKTKIESNYLLIVKIAIAFIALFFSSHYFIKYALKMTDFFGVAETTIGITVVAFGTALPEVIATIISILKKQYNLAIGNILGSNIANIFGITLIAIWINGDINYYNLLTDIDKWLFLITSILFFIIIYLRLAGKLISIGLVLSYLAYFIYLYF